MNFQKVVRYAFYAFLCLVAFKDVLAAVENAVDDRPYYRQDSIYYYLHGKHHCYSYGTRTGKVYESISDDLAVAKNNVKVFCESREGKCVADECVFK